VKKLRVLALMHPDLVPPDDAARYSEAERFEWKTEWDVVRTLRDMGHDVRALGVQTELQPIRAAVEEFKPHIAFNLLEEFQGNVLFDQNVVSLLELLKVPYTGCNPRGMVITREKALSKKLLIYHRIHVPAFHVFPIGRKSKRPRGLNFPLIVKSLTEHASLGISQASLVADDQELLDRVAFVHRRIATDAIAEQFIEGREIYVGVLGNEKPVALPVVELDLSRLPEGMPKIAGKEVKWDKGTEAYEVTRSAGAKNLDEQMTRKLQDVALQVYTALKLRDYGRVDMRLTPDGRVYVIEANPNPWLAPEAELAIAAQLAGRAYVELIGQIVELALARYAA